MFWERQAEKDHMALKMRLSAAFCSELSSAKILWEQELIFIVTFVNAVVPSHVFG